MEKKVLWAFAAGALCAAAIGACASGGSSGTTTAASERGGGTSGQSGGGALRWWKTCGHPACPIPDPDDPGVPNCESEQAGQPCAEAGRVCEPRGDTCGATLRCAETDPTSGGQCPISRARHKRHIRYLEEEELRRLHDDLVATPLAAWRYKREPEGAREHLGFIIDDVPGSPAVAESGEHVDLYGYASMAAAALQVQSARIEKLEHEIDALRREVKGRRP